MKTDIISAIKLNYNTFSKTKKKVADFILNDPRSVLSLSITDLSGICKIGEATIFRFCQDINLKGYQDLKIAIAQSLSPDNTSVYLNGHISDKDSVSVI